MSAGAWIYEADGTLRMGPGTSVGTVAGVVSTGKANGSITDPRLASGTPFILSAMADQGTNYNLPRMWFSGTTLNWSFRVSGANYNQSCRIIYGFRA